MKPHILIASGPWDAKPWAAAVGAIAPGRPVRIWPDLPDPGGVAYVLAWNPPAAALRGLPNLKAIFSLGAGVEHIMFLPGLPDVPVVRIVSRNLTQRMTEWVALQVLLHHRRQRAYDRQQRARIWKELPQPAATDVRVGVMGLGVLGSDAATALKGLGFLVAGWTRRPRASADIETFSGAAGLDLFLARTDILVCLLPLTNETRGILSMELFQRLARDGPLGGPVLINAGRGGLQVEPDVVAAVRDHVLIGASLDVFASEPLDPSSPLWAMDNVVITPHCAAWSDPAELSRQILDQIAAVEAGRPLRNVVDRSAAY